MNKQQSKTGRGIEWTDYTWNPIAGCQHECRWAMPDGSTAICYAENVADRVAGSAYPEGFAHHYWKPSTLNAPKGLKTPSKIFVGSMADVFGKWVPDEQIRIVLDACASYPQHQFQFLTKNAPRLEKFDYPPNVWIGVSAPPTHMFGHELTRDQQVRMIIKQEYALKIARLRGARITWMSIEPLSFDIAPYLQDMPLNWAVIGAATNGRTVYQPEPQWVNNAVDMLVAKDAAIFFKGNLRGNPAANVWLEEFPN